MLTTAELAPADIETSLYLIGDAGEPDPRGRSKVLDSMAVLVRADPRKSVVVFLGDNVYPDGIPEEGRAEYADARRRLQVQVDAIPPGVRAFFIPGNHDWAGSGPFGLYAVRLQEQMLGTMASGRDIRMVPSNGCPGPVPLDFGRLRFIALDTQWWLHSYIIRDAVSKCQTDPAGVTAALRQQISGEVPGRVVVVGAHHPLMTGGEHGGYCGIAGPFRRLAGHSQDILSSLNRAMRDSIETAFAAKPPLVYAAGHEHNIQVLRGGATVQYLLVSGAGSQSKVSCGVWLRESYYVAQHRTGFMRLDIMRDKGVFLRVYTYTGEGRGGVSYSHWLEPQ
ncbi:MAG: hypothetical protein ACSLFK_03275 [Gemmatimonadaceae bacterium]